MYIVTASDIGQIVIPEDIRKQLRILPGKKFSIKTEGCNLLMTPLPDNPAEFFCGIFKDDSSLTEELLKERKEDKERESEKIIGQFCHAGLSE